MSEDTYACVCIAYVYIYREREKEGGGVFGFLRMARTADLIVRSMASFSEERATNIPRNGQVLYCYSCLDHWRQKAES